MAWENVHLDTCTLGREGRSNGESLPIVWLVHFNCGGEEAVTLLYSAAAVVEKASHVSCLRVLTGVSFYGSHSSVSQHD